MKRLLTQRFVAPLLAFFALTSVLVATAAERPDLVVADFEGLDYGDWQVTGTAFGVRPATGTLPGQQLVSGFAGFGLVNTFLEGDGSTGTLHSAPFRLERQFLNLLVGGGRHPQQTAVNLLVDGRIERTATGDEVELLRPVSWDISALEGRLATLEIVDHATGGWGHINVDQVVQSDVPRLRFVEDREGALLRAMASVQNAAERAARDQARPQYHFRPPANWMNDPNGPLHFDGWHHLFYQHNPYGDGWDQMHWGHARSRDLVFWEHLPIALWPSRAAGEQHCFSGCATTNALGRPMIFYTSIGHAEPHCWIAQPEDRELRRWRKFPENPILTQSTPGVPYFDFRDPFVFRHANRVFMVQGGNLNQGRGGQAVVSLFEAENPELTAWKYRGILFEHPDPKVGNIECPLFFPLGKQFVLITSPHRSPDWFVGSFDPDQGRFTPDQSGVVDAGNFYAPNAYFDDAGRCLLWGWVNGFQPGPGWNGCMTLPRVLTVADGQLRQHPAPEVDKLRQRGVALAPFSLRNEARPIPADRLSGDLLELRLEIRPGTAKATGLRWRTGSTPAADLEIRYDGEHLEVAGTRVPARLIEGVLTLRVFLDRSVVEVYANDGRVAVTKVVPFSNQARALSVFAEGGEGGVNVDAWELRPAW